MDDPAPSPDLGSLEAERSDRLLAERALEREQAALAALAAAGERLEFLADASAILAMSLEVGETLHHLADLTVPRLADWCAVDMVEDDGAIELVAVARVDPSRLDIVREKRRHPVQPDAPRGVANVVRTGRSELLEEMPPEIEEVAKRRPDLVGLLGDVQPRSVMTVPLAAGGRVLGAMTFAFADSGRRYTRADLTLAEDLARRAAVAIENARLYELEREARREGEEARLRLQVLAEAGAAMAASLEVRPALASLTGAAARRICDYSLAYLLGPEGRIVDAVGAHRDPARFGSVERLALATLPDLDSEDDLVAGVLRTGEPMLVPDVTPELRDRVMAPGEQRALALELGFSSVIVAPLLARGRTLGALALVRAGDSPAFDEDDLSFATALAARGGLGVDNARLYAEREYVADTLQRSLLPPVLPEVAGLEVGARYVPASEGTQVGGDFYDVFGADGDHWIAVIGDVVGKGAQAAAMMGLARYTIRTAAIAEGRPSAILQTLNRGILSQTGEQRFCTACCVRLLRSGYGARMTVSVGGHPLPLVLHEDGSIDEVGTPGTVLGVFEDATLADQVVDLSHGDALVTFTDGVTDERDGGEEFGESRLNEVLFSLAGRSAQQIADGVLDAVLGFRTGEPKDDIAILVLKVVP